MIVMKLLVTEKHRALLKQMGKALAIGFVERLQLIGCLDVPDVLMAGEQRWHFASLKQPFCRRAADHVDNGGAGYGRDRPGCPV
jgi:hypothetical protein